MSFTCRKRLSIILLAAITVGTLYSLTACRASAGGPLVERPAGEPFSVTATIRFIDLEGGFFGIFADDGRRFDPMNLPKEFKVNELRVKVGAVTVPDAISYHMWGKVVRVESIEKLAQ